VDLQSEQLVVFVHCQAPGVAPLAEVVVEVVGDCMDGIFAHLAGSPLPRIVRPPQLPAGRTRSQTINKKQVPRYPWTNIVGQYDFNRSALYFLYRPTVSLLDLPGKVSIGGAERAQC